MSSLDKSKHTVAGEVKQVKLISLPVMSLFSSFVSHFSLLYLNYF